MICFHGHVFNIKYDYSFIEMQKAVKQKRTIKQGFQVDVE